MNRVYREIGLYILLYVLYYCVLSSVLEGYGIGLSFTTAFSMLLAINSVRRHEKKHCKLSVWDATGVKKVKLSLKEAAVLVFMGISLNFIAGGVINLLPASLSQGYSQSSFKALSGSTPVTVVFIALVTPLLEEILFRGVFQRKLMGVLGEYKGLVVASLIFGLMHFNIIWSVYTTIIGFYLGIVYLYYGSVLPGALVHCVFNLVSCVPLVAMKYETLYKYTFGTKLYVVITLAVGIAIMYALFEKTWLKSNFANAIYAFKALGKEEIDVNENDE